MAQATSNIATPAQTALNSKLYGTNSSTPQASIPTPASTNNLQSGLGYLGGIYNKVAGAPLNILGTEVGAIGSAAKGLYNYATAPSGTSYTAAQPNAPATPAQPVTPPPPPASSGAPASSVINPQPTTPLYPPGSPQNGGGITQANTQPNLPVSPPAQTSPAAPISYPGLVGSLVGTAENNVGIGQNATDIANKYAPLIGSALTQGANMQAGDLSTGSNVVGEGNAAIASEAASQRASALTQAEQAALAGTGQQLTAQQQEQQGLGAAVNATQPQLGGIGTQQYYQPLNAGQTPTGTPFTAGEVAGQQAAGQNIVTMKTAYAQATGIHQQISQLLQQNPTLNASPAAVGNAINQWVNSTQVPSGPYVNLLNDLQEYANTIAPVLGVTSGNVTDAKQAIAQGMVPILASGGTIEQALTNLETTASGKINQAQTVGQNPNAPVTAPTQNTPSASVSGFGWNG